MKLIFTIDSIDEDNVLLKGDDPLNQLYLSRRHFDTFSIHQGKEVEIEINLPYEITSERRRDIEEHHAEEARCGNI